MSGTREPLSAKVARALKATALHARAMSAADAAIAARKAGTEDAAGWCFRTALLLEREAAELVEVEPTRGVLCRSAAHLAIEAGDPVEAVRLAEVGLAGGKCGPPPADIAKELLEVRDRARAAGHAVVVDHEGRRR